MQHHKGTLVRLRNGDTSTPDYVVDSVKEGWVAYHEVDGNPEPTRMKAKQFKKQFKPKAK